MQSLCGALLVASALVSAAPAPDSPRVGTMTLAQVAAGRVTVSGPLELAKAYRKFGKPLPDDLADAIRVLGLARREASNGSVEAAPESQDVAYTIPILVGTPPQKLSLDLDTGSSDLWVFGDGLAADRKAGHNVYKPADSSTASLLPAHNWTITYGDQSSASGSVYTDAVRLGNMLVADQAVESAEKVADQFVRDTHLDGLLGLAFSKLNTVRPQSQKTWFDRMLARLDAPVFTADLRRGQSGSYNFGYIDAAAHRGPIAYTDVDTSRGFWEFTSPGYRVGTAATITQAPVTGIADTGTTLLLLPTDVVQAYYAQVTGALYDVLNGGYTFSCDTALPAFAFAVTSNATVTVPGNYINFAPTGTGRCFGGIQSSSGIGISIFGDVALKAAFVVFDGAEKPRLGWAEKAQ